MNVISTRGGVPPTSLSDAILAGLAPDGGLYVPQALPRLDLAAFERATDLPAIAEVLLEPFFAGDRLAASLPALCAHAYAFDAPLVALPDGRSFVLELFHGPTAAFKDFGARFLAAAMGALRVDVRVVVLSAIDFDDEPRLDAGEVGDIRADGMLAAEAMAVQLFVSQCVPELLLRVRHCTS